MRAVGETNFVKKLAEKSAADKSNNCQVAAGIIATSYLNLGFEVIPVLEAHVDAAGGRLRRFRYGVSWHSDSQIPNIRTNPSEGLLLNANFMKGYLCLGKFGLIFECWC